MRIGNLEVYGIIYKITNKVNGKSYIGQTRQDNGFRGRYSYSGEGIERVYIYYKKEIEVNDKHSHVNYHLFRSIEKYGFENFEVTEIYDVAFSQQELNIKEDIYIEYFDCINNGYNTLKGGQITPYNSGEDAWNSKYCNTQIKKKKKMLSENKSFKDIAKLTGIDKGDLCSIYSCDAWKGTAEEYNEKIYKLYNDKRKAREFDCDKNIEYLEDCYNKGMTLRDILIDIGYFNNDDEESIQRSLRNIYLYEVKGKIQEKLKIFEFKNKGEHNKITKCNNCGKEIIKLYGKYGYLCRECRREYRIKIGEIKFCEICGREITIKNNNQKYCKKCAKSVNRKKTAKRVAKSRSKKR